MMKIVILQVKKILYINFLYNGRKKEKKKKPFKT